MRKLKYPIGISDFAEMCNNGYYYIDKTNLIVDLLDKGPVEVTQITRPRRFGKTLGIRENFSLMDGSFLFLHNLCQVSSLHSYLLQFNFLMQRQQR